VSTERNLDLIPTTTEAHERNWLPLAIAAGIVVVAVIVAILIFDRKQEPTVTPVNAPLAAYAGQLPISAVTMSESGNLAGGKVTYVDGHIANQGNQTVTGITVQVLFRDPAKEVTQNETRPLQLIRTRDPYVDLQPVSAAPLKPRDQRDFRLIFDAVSPDWDGAYPEIRIVHVDAK